MKFLLLFISIFLFLINPLYAVENCKETKDIGGKFYWYNSAVHGTSISSEDNEKRIWYINTDPAVCYKSLQAQINNPALIYSGYVMALKNLGDENSANNLIIIKKLTGITFNDSGQFNRWFDKNSANFFWSFEKNRIVVLENGFRCNQINPAGGKLYWFNYFLGSVKDMDTSPDKRLWSSVGDDTTCFISLLIEINNRQIIEESYQLALNYIGTLNDEMEKQIINRFKKINVNKLIETGY